MLKISNLTCERDDRILFQKLSHEFSAATITQLEGPNGAGKTTLLRIFAGLFSSFSGDIYWQNRAIDVCRVEFNDELLFIGHKSAVKPNLSPLENLEFLIGLNQHISQDLLYEALRQVGLYGYEHVLCRNLSAGQQRRVALARLYLSKASIWILDEIFTAIDKQGVRQLEALLYEKAKSGVCIILTTHHQLSLPEFQVLNISHFTGNYTDNEDEAG